MTIGTESGRDWAVALRRHEARTAEGQPTGCYTNTIEIICRDCGDDPGRDITTSRLGCSGCGIWLDSQVMLMSDANGHDRPEPLEPAAPQSTMPEFACYVVNRLFSVGLSLESARSIVGNGPAGERIAAATDEVDRLIRDFRTAALGLAADRENQSPDRWPFPPGEHFQHVKELLGSVVMCIFNVGGLLEAVADLSQDATRLRITEALHWLDDLAGKIQPIDAAIARSGLLEVEVVHLPEADYARPRSKVALVYDVKVACPECGTQQAFRGTIAEIGDAAERWSSEHRRATHADGTDKTAACRLSERHGKPFSVASKIGCK